VRRSPLALALVALLPLAFLPAVLQRVADSAAKSTAVALDGVTRSLFGSTSDIEPRLTYVEPLVPVDEPVADPAKPRGKIVPLKGIRVREAAVLRLANAGMRPSGIPVPARGGRPAGLALVGVSGLGIGMMDGDVLVQAGGRPTLTPGDVVGVVVGSRAHKASEISGRFYRNGEPWNLVVEQPYLQRPERPPETGPVALVR
jgi:hypothetical protein